MGDLHPSIDVLADVGHPDHIPVSPAGLIVVGVHASGDTLGYFRLMSGCVMYRRWAKQITPLSALAGCGTNLGDRWWLLSVGVRGFCDLYWTMRTVSKCSRAWTYKETQ